MCQSLCELSHDSYARMVFVGGHPTKYWKNMYSRNASFFFNIQFFLTVIRFRTYALSCELKNHLQTCEALTVWDGWQNALFIGLNNYRLNNYRSNNYLVFVAHAFIKVSICSYIPCDYQRYIFRPNIIVFEPLLFRILYLEVLNIYT